MGRRGRGLVMGVELVKDKQTKRRLGTDQEAHRRGRPERLLIGSVGVFGNVIRVAPPLVITRTSGGEPGPVRKESGKMEVDDDNRDSRGRKRGAR